MTQVEDMFATLSLSQSIDTKVDVLVVDTRKVSVREVFDHLHLKNDNRFKDETGFEEPHWGQWQKNREGKTLEFRMTVGCSCMHDCCGCMCGLTYSMVMNGKYLMVIIERGFNR